MSNDITVTDSEINRALQGILMHLKVSGLADKYNSFAEAMEELRMWDFAFNQAEVTAYLHAGTRRLDSLIHNRD